MANQGGKGAWENLTPLTRAANSEHENKVESIVKAGVDSGAVLRYSVEAVYGRSDRKTQNEALKEIIENEHFVPKQLNCRVAYLVRNGNSWVENNIITWTVKNEIGEAESSYFLSDSKKPEEVRLYEKNVGEIVEIIDEHGRCFRPTKEVVKKYNKGIE